MTDIVDIVTELRDLATYPQPSGRKRIITKAAGEIERLREALRKIATAQHAGDEMMVIETARAALAKGGET